MRLQTTQINNYNNSGQFINENNPVFAVVSKQLSVSHSCDLKTFASVTIKNTNLL